MANKVRFYHLWSIRNILSTVVVSMLLVLMLGTYFYYPQLSNYYKRSRFDEETNGILLNIEERTVINQTKFGNKLNVLHYEITYKFDVDDNGFTHTDIVSATLVNKKALDKAWNSDKKIAVKYLSNNPEHSMVNLESM